MVAKYIKGALREPYTSTSRNLHLGLVLAPNGEWDLRVAG